MIEIILFLVFLLSTVICCGCGAYVFSKINKEIQKKIIAGFLLSCLVLVGAFITIATVIEPCMADLKQHNVESVTQTHTSNSSENPANTNQDSNINNNDFESGFMNLLKQPVVIFMFATMFIIAIGKWVYKRI